MFATKIYRSKIFKIIYQYSSVNFVSFSPYITNIYIIKFYYNNVIHLYEYTIEIIERSNNSEIYLQNIPRIDHYHRTVPLS